MLALTMLTPSTMHHHQCAPASEHPPKRPKLSLLTTGVTKPLTFGKSTTGLSIPVASSSPTLLNTFSNAYNPSPAAPAVAVAASRPSCPYTLPYGHRSILRNGPIPVRLTPRSARRLRFPRVKRVKYTTPLVETIPIAPASPGSGVEEEDDGKEEVEAVEEQVRANARRVDGLQKGKSRRSHRERTSEQGLTPIYGPRQKREWTWTLGPVERSKETDEKEGEEQEEEAETLQARTYSPHPASAPASARPGAGGEAARSPRSPRARPYPLRRPSTSTTTSADAPTPARRRSSR
ncbi:MAG: hypothetical protein M1829_002357 [Trizodia sp. TS-e1964]|nr:MAG: hypothetical protein M1829_002357 [Trizodia sp. TS-e1964]